MAKDMRIWYWTRRSFYAMVTLLFIGLFLIPFRSHQIVFLIFYVILLPISIVSCFVFSILHLRKYKEKELAVIALVLSSGLIIFITLIIAIGLTILNNFS